MTQISGLWNGAVLGDADALTVAAADGIGYRLANSDYESYYVDRFSRMIFNGDENRGVLKGWLNELEVTGVGSPVAVNTGGAIVYGMPYQNTSSVNVAVTSPTNDTRQDRIVLRRNWAAQTIRITLITGVEGGGVPAMTQSPAPSGSGIYDIPLANLSTTIGGVITVTDAREFCRFGTVPGAGAIGTTQIADSSVDWADRQTRTCRYWLAGGDLRPTTAAGNYTSSSGGATTWTGASSWDGGANTQGWELTGSAYEGVYGSFSLPANYAGGEISSYVWWVDNGGIASTFSLITNMIMFNSEYDWNWWGVASANTESVNESLVASDWYRSEGVTTYLEIQPTGTNEPINTMDDLTLFYVAYWYNSAGAEDISIMGVELIYTGYV